MEKHLRAHWSGRSATTGTCSNAVGGMWSLPTAAHGRSASGGFRARHAGSAGAFEHDDRRARVERATEGGQTSDTWLTAPESALLAVVALVIVFLVVWFFVFPVLVLSLDILLVIFLALVGIATRVLFRRPWTVQAETRGEQREWQVVGWGPSRATVAVIARALQKGQPLPPSRFTVP